LDVREILRRIRLGDGHREVARDLGVSRKTVAKYGRWARDRGLLEGPLPEPGALQALLRAGFVEAPPPVMPFKAEAFRDFIVELRKQKVEIQAILQRLREEKGYVGSYASVHRFVRSIEPRTPEVFVRVETAPGEEAQVDFGYAGRMLDPGDGKAKKAWAFVMTLSWSRHQYVEFVFQQDVATWLRCHRNAFEWFGGVPARIVPDNLKAAIVKASLHDPIVQRAYREFAEHYGFRIAPCRPRTPQHKGKVEKGGVHYVARNFLAGRDFRDIHDASAKVLIWCDETAGKRIHGTTKERPLDRFSQVEKTALLELPASRYAIAIWKQAKLHPDCHVVFEHAFYSAPHRLVGKKLWVRGADTSVVIFHDHEPVASHPRAAKPGERRTQTDHLPPAKVVGLMTHPGFCLKRAHEIGPKTEELVGRLLGERPLDRLRTAMAILKLAHKYSPRRLEAACLRALTFDELGYGPIKRILDRRLDLEAVSAGKPLPLPTPLFARPVTDFFPSAEGGR
jgi:transposase